MFMILGVTEATLFATLIGNNFKLLKVLSDFTYSIGLSATGTVIAPPFNRLRGLRDCRLADTRVSAQAL